MTKRREQVPVNIDSFGTPEATPSGTKYYAAFRLSTSADGGDAGQLEATTCTDCPLFLSGQGRTNIIYCGGFRNTNSKPQEESPVAKATLFVSPNLQDARMKQVEQHLQSAHCGIPVPNSVIGQPVP